MVYHSNIIELSRVFLELLRNNNSPFYSEIYHYFLEYHQKFNNKIIPKKETFSFYFIHNSKKLEVLGIDFVSHVSFHLLMHKQIDNPKIIISFLKSLSYFGLYDIFSYFDFSFFHSSNNIELLRFYSTMAKLYKGSGEIALAQLYFNKAIEVADVSNNPILLAYSLTLQSKLFSDYYQRKGLCFALSRISYQKVKIDNKTIINGQHHRWLQICWDNYAKLIYPDHPRKSEEIFNYIIKNHKDQHTTNRTKFRLLECRLNNYLEKLSNTNSKYIAFKIYAILIEYENLIEDPMYFRNNEKVRYIRKIHLLKIYRKLKLVAFKCNKSLNYRINTLIDYEAISVLDDCIQSALHFSDRKMTALAYLEKSYWIEFSSSNLINDIILNLNLALAQFQDNITEANINQIYFEILERLSSIYIIQKNYRKSAERIMEIYKYLDFLKKSLENDRLELNNFQRSDKFSIYKVFTKQEISLIQKCMFIDYEELNNKWLKYGEKLIILHEKMMSSTPFGILTEHERFNHKLKNLFIKFDDIILEEQKSKDISDFDTLLLKLLDVYSDMKKAVHGYIEDINKVEELQRTDFSISQTIENILKINSYIHVKFIKEKDYIINSFKNDITYLIENLCENALESADRNNIENPSVLIRVQELDNYINILFKDNCGDCEYYLQVIEKLNKNESIISKKTPDILRRTGLQILWEKISFYCPGKKIHFQQLDNNLKEVSYPIALKKQ